jgi:hypothetical protein
VGQHISVSELKEYWEQIENLESGSSLGRYVATSELPPWEEICSELNWQHHGIGRFRRSHFGFPGIYRLVGLSSDGRIWDPAPISRVCREDTSGTLYIGEAGRLNQRLNQLRRSLRREDTHGASRMWQESEPLKNKFPLNKLGIGIFPTGFSMHPLIERDMNRAYLNSFGDTPPLNCSF